MSRALCDHPVGQMASIHDVPAHRMGGARLTNERAEGNVHARSMGTGQGMRTSDVSTLFFSLLAGFTELLAAPRKTSTAYRR